MPASTDITLICTNIRGTTGQRPVWADHTDSIFYFPWNQIRFLEIPPERASGGRAAKASTSEIPPLDDDLDEELDEEFLRRVREA